MAGTELLPSNINTSIPPFNCTMDSYYVMTFTELVVVVLLVMPPTACLSACLPDCLPAF